MIRTIVVPTAGSVHANNAVEVAGEIAGLFTGGVSHKVNHLAVCACMTVK